MLTACPSAFPPPVPLGPQVCVGFGVSEPRHATQIAAWGAEGVICGSALVRALGESKSPVSGRGGCVVCLQRRRGGRKAEREAEPAGGIRDNGMRENWRCRFSLGSGVQADLLFLPCVQAEGLAEMERIATGLRGAIPRD